jgi:hypothetical protein
MKMPTITIDSSKPMPVSGSISAPAPTICATR